MRSPLLAAASAVLLGAYALWPAAAFLPYVALVPWIVLYTDDRRPRVSHVWYILATWATWILSHTEGFRFGWFVPAVMGLVLIPAWWAFTPLLRPIHRALHWPRTLTVPIVWVAVEWLRTEFTLAHFDLYALGYSQARFPALIQAADVVGIFGVSFFVAAVNGLVADAWFVFRDGRVRGLASDRGLRRRAIAVGVAAAGMIAYGCVRLASLHVEDGPRLAVVQPNTGHTPNNAVGVFTGQILQTERQVPAGAADLIIWPENAILDDIRRPGAFLVDLRAIASRKRALLLVGASAPSPDRPGKTLNEAVLVDSAGSIRGEYAKQVLFPWTEFIPFDGPLGAIAPALQRAQRTLARKAWGFLASGTHGTEMRLLRLPWSGIELPFAALICVENAYPPIPADAGRLGARFFVNITSEGEVAGAVQEQLLRICMFRAVENRIAYVRCGNTGISGFIGPDGRLRSILRGKAGGTISVAGTLIDRVPLSREGATVYARSHDAMGRGAVLLTAALFLAALVRGRRDAARRAAAMAAPLLAVVVLSGCGGPNLGDDPSIAAGALARGRALVERGENAAALKPLARACADPVACRNALPLAAQAYRALGSDEAAAEFFAAVATKYPALGGSARAFRAVFLERSGDLAGAEAEMGRAVREDPGADNWLALANLRTKLRRQGPALDAVSEAERIAPSSARARYTRARILAAFGDTAEAKRLLEGGLDDSALAGAGWSFLAVLEMEAGDRPAAEAAAAKALAADPRNIDARYMRFRMALEDGRVEDAEAVRGEIVALEAALGRKPRGAP